MGHASITETAHIYADLYDGQLDDVASALDDLARPERRPGFEVCPYFGRPLVEVIHLWLPAGSPGRVQ